MNTWLRTSLSVMMTLLGVIDLAASTPDPIFVVGNEKVNAKEVILPHAFTNSPGVTLYQTLTDGYNLRLNGAIIEDGGIQSTVPFTIELLGLGENVITISGAGKVTLPFGGIDRSAIGIYACRGVKIIGPGSLTILNTANIAAASRTARSPVGIRVGKYGNFSGGGLTINRGASVSVKTHYGDGIVVDGGGDVDIGSSAVSTYSGTGNGIVAVRDYATLGGEIGKIRITASMLVDSSSRGLFASDAVEINAACCTLVNEHYSACANSNFHADQSVVNAYSATEDVITGGKKIFLGEGVYNLAAGTRSRGAIHGDNVVIDGADITCCVPGGFGVWYVDDCVMRGGTLRLIPSMDVRGSFAAGSLASIAVGTADSWRSIANGEAFYAAAFSGALDLVGSLFVHNPSGAPLCGVYSYYNNGAGRLAISGGTLDTTQAGPFGFCVKSAEVSGGSVHGEFVHEVHESGHGILQVPLNPVYDGQLLECVTEKISGAKEGDKITEGWRTSLPDYYGTRSLYADKAGNLYFWLPVGFNTFTLKASGQNGTVTGGGDYKAGALVTLKATAKEGYVFTGWYTDADCTKKLNPTGYDNRKPTIKITMPAKATTIYAKFNSVATDKSGLKFSDSTAKLATTPKAYAANAKVSLALGFSSKSYPKVTASGLPDGLAIDAITGKIAGSVKKPGAYTVKVTVTSAAGNKITQNVKIDIKAPSWATGTFSGYGTVTVKGKKVPVSATFTATAVGKVSGKLIYKGRSAPFTANYASATDTEARFTVKFSADGVSFKSAMSIKEKTSGLTYTRAHALAKGSFELELQKVVPLVQTGKSLAGMIGKSYTFKQGYEGSGLTKSGDKLVVKFAEKDVVKISGVVKGKSFSGLSVLAMACGKSKTSTTTKYKLDVPVIAGTVGYYRLLTFKVTIDTKTKKVTKVEKAFSAF